MDQRPHSSGTVTLGLLQHASPVGASKAEMLERVAVLAREAVAKGAQVIATQELLSRIIFASRKTPH